MQDHRAPLSDRHSLLNDTKRSRRRSSHPRWWEALAEEIVLGSQHDEHMFDLAAWHVLFAVISPQRTRLIYTPSLKPFANRIYKCTATSRRRPSVTHSMTPAISMVINASKNFWSCYNTQSSLDMIYWTYWSRQHDALLARCTSVTELYTTDGQNSYIIWYLIPLHHK